jgi:hypothetical protein
MIFLGHYQHGRGFKANYKLTAERILAESPAHLCYRPISQKVWSAKFFRRLDARSPSNLPQPPAVSSAIRTCDMSPHEKPSSKSRGFFIATGSRIALQYGCHAWLMGGRPRSASTITRATFLYARCAGVQGFRNAASYASRARPARLARGTGGQIDGRGAKSGRAPHCQTSL